MQQQDLIDEFHKRLQSERRAKYNQHGNDAFESTSAEAQWADDRLREWIDEENRKRIERGQPPLDEKQQGYVASQVRDRVFGLGEIDKFLRDQNVADIHVMAPDHCMLRLKNGEWRNAGRVAADNDELLRLIQTAAARHGGNIERRFDSLNPELNMQLKDGSRLFALRDVVDSPQLVIRKHDHSLGALPDLVNVGMMSPATAHFLQKAVQARLNIIVIGATSSGKTTLLRAMCAEMPPHESKVTIEEAREIGLARNRKRHPLVRELETRPPDMQGNGAVTAQQLVRMSLRMDPDRVILGEVRGAEALQMLTAMSQGQKGSMCTMHGDSAVSCFSRLQLYVKQGDVNIDDEDVARLTASSVNFVVYATKMPMGDGTYRRVIREIVETRGSQGTRVASNELVRFDPQWNRQVAVTKPSDDVMDQLLEAGFDYNWWAANSVAGPIQQAQQSRSVFDQQKAG